MGTPHHAGDGTGRDAVTRVIVAVVLTAVLGLALSRTLFPYDLGHYEGGIWAPAALLVHGENPWSSARATTPPFVMAPYGPLYCALVGVGLAVFGPQFWWGRTLAWIALLLTSACLFALTRRLTERRDLALLAALAFLAQPAAQHWLAVQRPDAVALLLGLAAMTAATGARPRIGAIVLCLAGAVLARQTSILPYAAVVAWLAVAGRRRDAIAVAVLAPALLSATMLTFQLTSGGGYLWQQFTLPATVPRSPAQLGTVLGILGRAPATWMVLALIPLAIATPTTMLKVAALRALLVAYFAAAVGLAAITSARLGSNVNYWLEPSALAAVLAALGAERVARRTSCIVPLVAVAAAALVGLLPLGREEAARWHDRAALDGVVRALAAATPPTEPVLTGYPELAVYAGRAYWFNDGIQYDDRSPAHREHLLRALRDRTFPAIVLPYDQPPQGYQPAPATPPATHPPAFLFVRR